MIDSSHLWLPPARRRGITRADVLAILAILAILLAIAIPVASAARGAARGSVSASNLLSLGAAHDCYAADWSGRQFVALPDDLGVAGGSCLEYINNVGCIPPLLVGYDGFAFPSLWGFYVSSSGRCGGSAPSSFPSGSCNLTHLRPLSFDTPKALGVHRFGNARPLQNYVSGRFYDPLFYAPDDAPSYTKAAPFFNSPVQFPEVPLAPTSYILSAAAMYHPDVFRRPSLGGFQHPDQLAHGYQAPRVAHATYPALKTRLIEHFWLASPPAPCNPGFQDHWVSLFSPGCSPYTFSQGADAVALALFFDGSVQRLATGEVIADDERLREHAGGDGLWSHDTPYGKDGYLGQFSFDGTTTGHHVLTTDGILGRDVLR